MISPQAAGVVISSALRLDKTSVSAGQTLNASVTYRNTSSARVEIWTIMIAGRRPGGTHTGGPYDDFAPTQGTMWLEAGASVTLNASRTFSASDATGRWESYSTYQDSTGWHDGPSVFFDVGTQPAGGIVISTALKLDKTSVTAGQTMNASVTYRNTSSSPIAIGGITIAGRRPGATHAAGPYDDFAPTQGATTLQAGASVTLNASRAFSATDPTGRWESYSTYQDSSGAFHDGPSVFFDVGSQPAGGIVISSALTLDKTSVTAGQTMNASVTYRNTSSSPINIGTIVIAGRRPGATHAEGPYDDFAPTQGMTTLQAGASVTLNASRAFTANDPTGRWEAYSTYQDNSGAFKDGPSVFFDVVSQPTGGIVISTALKLDKTSVSAGQTMNASVTYRNSSSSAISIGLLLITGRRPGATHADGPYDDFAPTQGATTLQAGASVTLNASRAFTASDLNGRWESYSTYQDSGGAFHDGPSVFFDVVAGSQPMPPLPPMTGGMKLGTNFWYHTSNENNWSGETSMKTGINWATAYGAGTNGLAATNIWNDTFVAELAPYTELRFMDWGATNYSTITNWSQRLLPTDPKNYEIYIGAESPAGTAGMAYEWMIDLGNRLKKDVWICLPAKANSDYWTQLATLVKNKLQSDRRVYIEYSNETWNGSFTQFDYVNSQGAAAGLPGPNKYYQGQSYTVSQSLKIFQAFENVFGKAAMGTRVIRVYAYGGNLDTGRQALRTVYQSSTYNPSGQKIDMLTIAPYIGHSLDGAASDIANQFRRAIMTVESEDIPFVVQDQKTNNIAMLGTYEGGQHLLKNANTWSSNPAIAAEYTYMLNRWSSYFTLFNHYSHTGRWAPGQAWGSKDVTGQSTAQAHKYRSLTNWASGNP